MVPDDDARAQEPDAPGGPSSEPPAGAASREPTASADEPATDDGDPDSTGDASDPSAPDSTGDPADTEGLARTVLTSGPGPAADTAEVTAGRDTDVRGATATTRTTPTGDATAPTVAQGTAATQRDPGATALDETAFIQPLEKGLTIGDLTLVRKLGEGAQGVVWEAHQATLDRDVAVKVLSGTAVRSPDQVKRFQREAEAAGRLQHINIVATHGFQAWKGTFLIIQELLRGGDLDAEIQRLHADDSTQNDTLAEWAADTARQLAHALQHAHEHGVIHRDIKPSNILLDQEGRPKLTDFGLAKMEDDRGITRTGVAMGTPFYMSPEQVRAERGGLDHRTDIYSLGAVLYRMLTGDVPFTGKTREGLLLDILGRDPETPRKLRPGIDRDLEAISLKCLEKDPDDRYRTMSELASDLERHQRGEGITARQLTVVNMPFRRMRRLATSGLVLFAALAPVTWLAVDLGLLLPAAAEDASIHRLRLAPLTLATLLFLWPLSVLVVRLARGRRWLRWPVAAAVLAVGGLQGWFMEQQRLDQLQDDSRQALYDAARDHDELRTERALASHRAAWDWRFTNEDLITLTYAELRQGRASAAFELIERMADGQGDPAVVAALQFAAHSRLGETQLADRALARLMDNRGSLSADEALMIGDVFVLTKQYGKADQMYRLASIQGANSNEVNYAASRLQALLCDWDQADIKLQAASSFIGGQRIGTTRQAIRIAAQQGRWDEVDELLALLRTQRPYDFLELAFDTLCQRGRVDEAIALVDEVVAEHGDRADIVHQGAYKVFGRALADASDPSLLEKARDLYLRMEELEDGDALARLGLQAVHTQMYERGLGDEHLAQAESWAERGRRLAPDDARLRYARSQILLFRSVRDHGHPMNWPMERLDAWIAYLQAVLEVDGLLLDALNNLAYARGVHALREDDRAELDEALRVARVAVLQAEPPEDSTCPRSQYQRKMHATVLDTLSTLHEWAGEDDEALAAARRALAALDAGDPDHAKRLARVEALESPQR